MQFIDQNQQQTSLIKQCKDIVSKFLQKEVHYMKNVMITSG